MFVVCCIVSVCCFVRMYNMVMVVKWSWHVMWSWLVRSWSSLALVFDAVPQFSSKLDVSWLRGRDSCGKVTQTNEILKEFSPRAWMKLFPGREKRSVKIITRWSGGWGNTLRRCCWSVQKPRGSRRTRTIVKWVLHPEGKFAQKRMLPALPEDTKGGNGLQFFSPEVIWKLIFSTAQGASSSNQR